MDRFRTPKADPRSERQRTAIAPVALALVACASALALGACGFIASGSNNALGQYPTTTTPGVTLSTEASPVGHVLSTATGYTLYDFAPDTPTSSACVSAVCVLEWPPLTVPAGATPTVAHGLHPSLVGTLRRSDGSVQVTYGGHPLYQWNADVRPGMITGQAIDNEGGRWYVVTPSGAQVTTPFSVGGP